MKKDTLTAWIIRFAKGIFVGTGFILPGVSGGALAAIFGLYERLISTLANLTKNVRENALYFLPVALGMLAGIVVLAYPLSFFLAAYPAPTIWFFIGAICGTFPSLWKESGKKGRRPRHIAILCGSFTVGLAFLLFGSSIITGHVPQNFFTWVLAGAIVALGTLVPGLSPSNFLLYMGMYAAMVNAFKAFDLAVLAPLLLGMVLCMAAFSKLMDRLFVRAYAGLFHFILGIVIASTLMIVPLDYNYLSWGALVCAATSAAGAALGWWMSVLGDKYKPAKNKA